MKKIIACTILLLAAFPACTIITDFSDPDLDVHLYSLEENVGDQISVALDADSTATLTLAFNEELPGNQDDDPALLALITEGTITLTVVNSETGVSFDLLASGTHVAGPAGPGQYNLDLADDRSYLDVVFYNEVSGGYSLRAGIDYTAQITVNSNDWFLAESFNRDVNVQ